MKYLSLTLLLLAALNVFSQEISTPLNISQHNGTERPPIMHTGPDGTIYISWIQATVLGGDIFIATSSDKGHTFSAPMRVTDSAKVIPDFQRGGEFAIDTKNNIHMVWVEKRVDDQQDVWYSRSTDKGATWTAPVAVSDDPTYEQDYMSIACDSSDRIYVSFLDERDLELGSASVKQLYLTRSVDGGITWSKNKRISNYANGIGGTCDCCKQDIAVSPEGHVYVAFRSNINNQRDMHVVRSLDAGVTFTPPILIQSSPWIIQACPVSGPNIALDKNEDLHAVWRDARDAVGAVRVYYAKLPKNSTSIPENIMLSGTEKQPDWPDVCAYNNGEAVAIVYQTFFEGMKYLLFNKNMSQKWTSPVDTTDSRKTIAQVVFDNDGTRYIAWTDDRNDNGDIFFARDTANLSPLAVKVSNIDGRSFISSVVTIAEKALIDRENVHSILISDVSGREIASYVGSSFIVPNIAVGVYLVKITTDKQVETAKIIVTK
jgi:hypothetical protein